MRICFIDLAWWLFAPGRLHPAVVLKRNMPCPSAGSHFAPPADHTTGRPARVFESICRTQIRAQIRQRAQPI